MTTNKSKVSICIPAYENGEGIRRLLTSLCGQSYTNFEVILTDDSKSDVVEKVVAEFLEQSSENNAAENCKSELVGKLTYAHNPEPLGPAGNWNKSMDLATGEYIKIMHQDDWFTYDDSLEKFVKMLDENPEAVLAFSGSRQVQADALKDGAVEDNSTNIYSRHISDEDATELKKDWRSLYINQPIGAPSATILRRTDLRFAPELRWLIDSEFYMRILQENPDFAYTIEDMVSIGVGDEQMTEIVRDNGELNMFEYGFVMDEFELHNEKKYRDKFISQALKLKMPYSKLASHQIPKEEYEKAQRTYRKELMKEYAAIIRHKIFKKE